MVSQWMINGQNSQKKSKILFYMVQMKRKLNLHTMMATKNIPIKRHLRALSIIWREDISKLIVIGKEKK